MNAEASLLDRAFDALRNGNLTDSEAFFRQLLNSPEMAGQALAGIGIIRLTQGDSVNADQLFRNALDRGPNADALYGLAVLAERSGDNQKALGYTLDALRLNPNHAGAQNRLEALKKIAFAPAPQAPPPSSYSPRPAPPPSSSYSPPPAPPPPSSYSPPPSPNEGVYGVILSADEERAKALAQTLLKRCEMKRRPRLSAYAGSILVIVGVLVLMLAALIYSPSSQPHTNPTLIQPIRPAPAPAPVPERARRR